MKKLLLLFAAAMLTVSVSAQKKTAVYNKFGDNWYVGANLGVATPLTDISGGDRLEGLVPKFSLRVGKNLTTVFGLAFESDLYFGAAKGSWMDQKTMIDAINVDLLGTFNLNNLLYGYLGQPRPFEVIAIIGGGYRHEYVSTLSGWNGKGGLDLTFNLGEEKAWQLYIEPAVVFGHPEPSWRPIDRLHYNHKGERFHRQYKALLQLSVGVIYKFKNSNGTHNYKIVETTYNDLDGQYTQK